MLRYGVRELLLVQPGASIHRAARPDAPSVREALARAARDRHDGRRGFGDWSEEEQRDWMGQPDGLEASIVYGLARHPGRLAAPPPWPQELGLLVAEALVASVGGRVLPFRRSSLPWLAVMLAGALGVGGLRTRAERREARRIGLTPETAPRVITHGYFGLLIAAFAAESVWRRRTRRRPERYPWMLENAANMIRRLDRRRAWQRAYRASETNVPSVQSSASP